MNNKEFTSISSIDIDISNIELRSFGSLDEALHAILSTISKCFGMEASYLSQIIHDKELLEIVAFHSNCSDITIEAGTTYQLKSTYCHSVADTLQTVVIENTHTDPVYQHTPAHQLFTNIGSYVGVPIILGKNFVYGTLCLIDTRPKQITSGQATMLHLLGRLLATQIVHEKVTQARVEAETELRNSEARYRELIERSPDMIVTINNGIIQYINSAGTHMLDFNDPQEILGRHMTEFIDESERNRVAAIIAPNDIYPDIVQTTEVHVTSRLGRNIIMEVSGFTSNRIKPGGIKLIARDITQRKAIEAELEKSYQEQQSVNHELTRVGAAKSHFVSVVSHEFRTALTGIQGFSEMMHTEDFTVEEMRDFAKDINEDAKRLNRMITEMLDLDRMESGKMALYRQLTDVNQLISEAVNTTTRTHQHSHQFTMEFTEALPHIYVDRDKIIQVVKNLVSNAIKYSPNGGLITITSTVHDDMIQLRFQDQGIGLTADAIAHIFKRYQRVDSDKTRLIKGTGLGLPITQQIVEMHNGKIWVESMPGQGATFFVALPIVPD